MFGTALSFTTPLVLTALFLLPVIWWLLRLMPPRPQMQAFPPTRLLAEIAKKEDTPHSSPWWLTFLRLVLAACAIFALAGPFWQPNPSDLSAGKPLLLVLDNGWTTARDWQVRQETAESLIKDAVRVQKPVALVVTTDPENVEVRLTEPEKALELLSAQKPLPFAEDRALTARRLVKAKDILGEVDVLWLASPLKSKGDDAFVQVLSDLGEVAVRFDRAPRHVIADAKNNANALDVTIKRLSPADQPLRLKAVDKDGISLGEVDVSFADDALQALVSLTLPIELRNEIVRLVMISNEGETIESVGATYLIDDRSRRRSVGLLTGVAIDQAQQPLLSPLYYIRRALEPFADLRDPGTPNISEAVPSLLQSGVSMIVMADVGTMQSSVTEQVRQFMEKGGTVVRFAGPRLAASEDAMTPVRLREGERNLGGSLTWEEPQKLARFSKSGPFAGMNVPDDIEIKRQVLAEPDFDLLQKTWAELQDGTPLVTAEQVGDGWLVLFHVTADATWSNLPISGAFVDMLVKLVAFSSAPADANPDKNESGSHILPPFQSLDAYGTLQQPLETAEPIALEDLDTVASSSITPPGYYGRSESLVAHNLMKEETSFDLLNPNSLLPQATISSYDEASIEDLRPLFFTVVMVLLLLDSFIVAAMAGLLSLNGLRRLRPALSLLFAGMIAVQMGAQSAEAQGVSAGDEIPGNVPFEATLTTRLGYVMTGDTQVDEISRAGLKGLTTFLSQRTALEPGEPIGVDITQDELAFFSLLYWPIHPDSPVPDDVTMARVDAFMKQGGTVLFDTRDQVEIGVSAITPANAKLRQIVANLDVPPLEPVPANHVLTRAFYLLQDFPGRWQGSPLWVEATEGESKDDEEARSSADGVSSILITANDFAGAWATDATGHSLLPTVPNDPNQRIYAYRTGVNIVMYTLTGNYKADQVHIPALLERLGQ